MSFFFFLLRSWSISIDIFNNIRNNKKLRKFTKLQLYSKTLFTRKMKFSFFKLFTFNSLQLSNWSTRRRIYIFFLLKKNRSQYKNLINWVHLRGICFVTLCNMPLIELKYIYKFVIVYILSDCSHHSNEIQRTKYVLRRALNRNKVKLWNVQFIRYI